MYSSATKTGNKHWFTKTLIVVAAAVCLVLGVIGIVLPVIPGLLFLALAVWLLARVSRRVARHLNAHPQWRRHERLWDRAQHLNWAQRLQLGFWLAGRSLVETGSKLCARLGAKNNH